MKCEQAMEWMDEYLDSELPRDGCDQLQEHLTHCQGCSGTVHSLHTLKSQAASLPRTITPQRDLWPEIASRIVVADFPKRVPRSESDLRKPNWRRAVRFWPWIAAAALCCTLFVFFSMRSGSRQQSGETAKLSGERETGNILPDQDKQETAAILPNGTQQQRAKPGTGLSPSSLGNGTGYRAYLLDFLTRVFVSNSGAYAVNSQYDSSFHPESSQVLRFEPDGTISSWEPALPSDAGSVYSVYPGSGGRLWLSCRTPDDRPAAFFEASFGDAEPPKEVGRLAGSFISHFAVSSQGNIFALGVRSDLSSRIRKLTRGQSITANIIHVIEPESGQLSHLIPMTLEPNFAISNWQSALFGDMSMTAVRINISLRPNGNFILSIPPFPDSSNLPGIKDLTGKEVVEYSQSGQVVRRWNLGISEPDARIGNILVDIDDSLIIEVTYPDAAAKSDLKSGAPAHRYFLRMNTSGTLAPYDELIPADETVIGWIGETREMVTRVNAAKQGMMEIRFRKLPI